MVLVTKHRRNVPTSQHHDDLREVFAKIRAHSGTPLNERHDENDHGHLLVEYPPQVAVSKLVNSLKGVPSRRLKQHFRPRTYRRQL